MKLLTKVIPALLIFVVNDAVAQNASKNTVGGIVIPANSIEFQEMAPFVKMGTVAGDMSAGPHGTFGIMAAEDGSPRHTHSGAYHGVVLSGTMVNPFGREANPPEMTAGSYWYVPAGVEHITACVSKVPCLFYFHANEGFDFTPVE